MTIRRLFEAQGTKKQAAVGWGGYAYRCQGCEHIDTHDKSATSFQISFLAPEDCATSFALAAVVRQLCIGYGDGKYPSNHQTLVLHFGNDQSENA